SRHAGGACVYSAGIVYPFASGISPAIRSGETPMTKVDDANPAVRATGSCLCGAVRYEVAGPLRDVVECHCAMCRKTHGHIGAYTATPKGSLRLIEARDLKWYKSSENARRGFCSECGGTLFFEHLK